ncbi:hypothetical protein F5884DRAFT_857745 [Xylogone sp. PMI_703]|nr:hypothetical protein F5884DRAFT_857745 [Xylogone sp. PMI_703]
MTHSPLPPHQSNLYHPGMQHLAEHGTNVPIPVPREQYMTDEAVHLHSAYNSPMPQHAMPYPQYTQPPRFYQQHQYHDSGLDVQYDGFRAGPPNSTHQYSTPPVDSPMLPPNEGMRGDLPPQRPETSHSRASTRAKTTKPRKTPKNRSKAEKDGVRLEAPYSEMAKGREQSIIAEMETWVNRPVAIRLREIETGKNPGKVKRPMNCFMLYRKAYKTLCSENNHQTISKMCAESWVLESEEVKERFHEWARVERENHQLAHPEYKFSPSKTVNEKTTRRKAVEDGSEASDDDIEGGRSVRQKTNSSYTPTSSSHTPYSREASTFPDFRVDSIPPSQKSDRSSRYEDIYPGQPYPTPYNESELERGQYYQQVIHRNPTHPSYEDVIIRRAAGPTGPSGSEMQLATGMDYLGLPGGQDYDIMQPSGEANQSIDPSLVQQNHLGDFNPTSPVDGLYYDGLQEEGRHWYRQYGMDPALYDAPVYFDGESMDTTHFQDPHLHEEVWGVESAEGARELQRYLSEP